MRRLPPEVARLPRRVRVAAALEALDPRERTVVALRLLEKLTPLEAAGALRTSVREVEAVLASVLARVAAESAAPRAGRAQRRAA